MHELDALVTIIDSKILPICKMALLQKNRVEEATDAAVVEFAIEQPAFGQLRVCNRSRIARAKRWCALFLVEEIIEIADDSSGDSYIDEKG